MTDTQTPPEKVETETARAFRIAEEAGAAIAERRQRSERLEDELRFAKSELDRAVLASHGVSAFEAQFKPELAQTLAWRDGAAKEVERIEAAKEPIFEEVRKLTAQKAAWEQVARDGLARENAQGFSEATTLPTSWHVGLYDRL